MPQKGYWVRESRRNRDQSCNMPQLGFMAREPRRKQSSRLSHNTGHTEGYQAAIRDMQAVARLQEIGGLDFGVKRRDSSSGSDAFSRYLQHKEKHEEYHALLDGSNMGRTSSGRVVTQEAIDKYRQYKKTEEGKSVSFAPDTDGESESTGKEAKKESKKPQTGKDTRGG